MYFVFRFALGDEANVRDDGNEFVPGGVNSQRVPDRRRFVRKIASLAALSAVTGLILGQRLPRVSAATDPVTTDTGLPSGTGTNSPTQVAFWDGTNDITGSNNFTWNGSELTINTASGSAISGTSSIGAGVQGTGTFGVIGNSGTSSGAGVYGATSVSGGVGILAQTTSDAGKPLVARSNSVTQSANLQEWQGYTSGGFPSGTPTAFSAVDPRGRLGIGTTAPAAMVDVNAPTGSDPIHARGSPPGTAPNAFVVQNLTTDNAKSQFTFRDGAGANRYSFGNDLAGTGQQNFFIFDEVNKIFPIQIDNTGHVHLLDLVFANGIRATEDGTGLAFVNDVGEKIALLDRNGNFQVKGTISQNPSL